MLRAPLAGRNRKKGWFLCYFQIFFYFCNMITHHHKETVVLEELSIGYQSKQDVKVVGKDISAVIREGEMTCLLGENGVGKSTLLRTLAGFQQPLSGRVLIGSRPLKDMREQELARLVGIVLTEKPDLQQMTVNELVEMGRAPYTGFWGRLSRDDRQACEEAMAMTGIEALKHRLVQTLSDGERQKVMITKALAQQTPIIYLDEPTAFLDYPSKVEMLLLLRRICREASKTVFLSTHDLELALQVADTVWLMSRLEGLRIGTPHELATQDDALRRFIERSKDISFDVKTLNVRIKST